MRLEEAKELTGRMLDDRVADWATVALGYPDHPAGKSLAQTLVALGTKRVACHAALGHAQVLSGRLRLAYVALFGLAGLETSDDVLATRVREYVERQAKLEPAFCGLMQETRNEVPTLQRQNQPG